MLTLQRGGSELMRGPLLDSLLSSLHPCQPHPTKTLFCSSHSFFPQPLEGVFQITNQIWHSPEENALLLLTTLRVKHQKP